MKITTFTTALILATLTGGCSRPAEQARQGEAVSEPAVRAAPIDPAFVGSIAEGNRAFGVALYKELAAKQGNLFISPISIVGAFGSVIAGAEGETRTVIARALRFPIDGGPALHPELGRFMRGLERDGNGATLSIANALWVQQGFAIKPAFARIAREDYGATSASLDFVSASQEAATRINAWVSGETRGRIPMLFGHDAFNDRTRLVVTNAVSFLGDWTLAVVYGQERPVHHGARQYRQERSAARSRRPRSKPIQSAAARSHAPAPSTGISASGTLQRLGRTYRVNCIQD